MRNASDGLLVGLLVGLLLGWFGAKTANHEDQQRHPRDEREDAGSHRTHHRYEFPEHQDGEVWVRDFAGSIVRSRDGVRVSRVR